MVIDSSGTLRADKAVLENAVVSGVVNAQDGIYNGKIDCPSFSSLPNETGGTTLSLTVSSTDDEGQYNQLKSWCNANSLPKKDIFACTLSDNPSVKYFSYNDSGIDYYPYFYFKDSKGETVYSLTVSQTGFGTYYFSDLKGKPFSFSITFGQGDIFRFKELQNGNSGLSEGQVYYRETSTGKQLFVV